MSDRMPTGAPSVNPLEKQESEAKVAELWDRAFNEAGQDRKNFDRSLQRLVDAAGGSVRPPQKGDEPFFVITFGAQAFVCLSPDFHKKTTRLQQWFVTNDTPIHPWVYKLKSPALIKYQIGSMQSLDDIGFESVERGELAIASQPTEQVSAPESVTSHPGIERAKETLADGIRQLRQTGMKEEDLRVIIANLLREK